MIEHRKIKSNRSIKESIRNDQVCQTRRTVISRPVTTFTSVPIKLVKYHLSKPITSRTKFIESIQKCTILCFRCKKLKPNTFLKESQVSPNKICDCSQQIHNIKIQKPQERKSSKPKSENYDYLPLYAEGKSIQSTPNKIRRLYSEYEAQKYVNESRISLSKFEIRPETAVKPKFLIFKGNNSEIVRDALKRREVWTEGYYSITCTVNFIWHPLSSGIKFDRLKSFLPTQVANHFEFHSELSNKISLFRNLSKYCKKHELSVFNFVPETFVFEAKASTYKQAIEKFCKVCLEKPSKTIWIIKPSSFNRGRGIEVFDSLEKFEELCSKYEENLNFIVQKYIENPLLFESRKFDIRMWVLITHENNVLVFPQGYIRTSSEPFSTSHLNNKFIHLTNNAIQKEGQMYGKFESGNQISFQDFEVYLKKTQNKDLSGILEEIHNMIGISVQSVKDKLNPRGRNFCFEIFGYDFIIDDQCRPWLIEVNTNPCLELSSPLLAQLIPRMIEDALCLTIDQIFPVISKSLLETLQVVDLPEGNLWQSLTKL